MKKLILIYIFCIGYLFGNNNQTIDINFNNLKIIDLIKVTSKVLNKNILLTKKIDGKVGFISNKPIKKNQLLNILKYTLLERGYNIVESDSIFRIVEIEQNKEVEVIYLKNADAKSVVNILNTILKKELSNITVDEESNSIIIISSEAKLKYLKELVLKLDKDRPQVYVQARVIEVNVNRADNVGVKYGLSGGNLGNNGLFSFATNMGGAAITSGIGDIINTSNNINNGLALGATINLLKKNQAIDIVSEPSLLCINNKESSIYVGETKTFQIGTTTTTGGNTNNMYKREDIGLTLKVKPRISSSSKVTLDISVVVEDAKVSSGTNPDTSKKDLKTTAIVSNGEAVILGGYIKKSIDYTEQKVPFFGDIPLFGSLFRNEIEEENSKNLVIIITPYIIPTSSDLTSIRNQLTQLKLLEDKFTKDLEIRLEQRKLKIQKDLVNRKMAIESIKAEQKEHQYNNKKYISNNDLKEKEKEKEKERHQKVVDNILDI